MQTLVYIPRCEKIAMKATATLAQLVEHPPCKRTVNSSSLLSGSVPTDTESVFGVSSDD